MSDAIEPLALRLKAVLERSQWLADDAVKVLRQLPSAELNVELAQIQIALHNPLTAWETLRAWSSLRERRKHPNGARLVASIRAALLTSISSRHRTWLGALTEVDALLALPDSEVPAAVDRLEAAPPARLDNAHSIYLAAARAAPASALPLDPPHRGGPMPQLNARGYVQVALLLGREVAHLVSPADAKTAKEILSLGQKVSGWKQGDTDLGPQLEQLVTITAKHPALRVVRAVLLEARHFLRSPDKVGSAVRPAARTTLELLPSASVLAAIDDELCRADCEAALERQKKHPSAAVGQAIWRGADAKGKANIWLMALADGRWALLFKLKSRWTLTEGAPDDVIATVPAERFADAVRAAQPFR